MAEINPAVAARLQWGRERGDKTNGIEQRRSNYEIPVVHFMEKIGAVQALRRQESVGKLKSREK